MKIMLIEWDDPGFSSSHWENREPFTECSVPCITCGVILHEGDEDIHIVLNLNNLYYSQGIVIPKSHIKRMRQLRIVERR